ncbi:MAG: DUF3307 domain-containing protein, partial [Patescibacteria group bacterium]
MTLLLNLFVAHLLADFVFQSNALIRAKHAGVEGQLTHAAMVTVLLILVLIPYWSFPVTWVLIAMVGATHFMQDVLKISAEKKLKKSWSTLPFFADQLLHGIFLFLAWSFLNELHVMPASGLEAEIFFNEDLSMLAVFLLLISFVLDIVIFQFQRRPKRSQNHRRDYEAMLLRLLAFAT